MSEKKRPILPLFPDLDVQNPQPTGSSWIINDDDPATVPVPLQVIINEVVGPYTEMDRKLWTFLLHAVWDELGKKQLHEINISEIDSVFRELGGKHDAEWIWQSAKRLTETRVSFTAKFDDPRFDEIEGYSNLFNAMISRQRRMSRTLVFEFPAILLPIIMQPSRFARLRVHFLIKLSGKYAVTLYEVLEGFVNRRDRTLTVSIEELRQWLKVPDNAYPDWKNFQHRVLRPAVEQINSDPLGAGFSVAYTPHREGRFYQSVTFTMTKTEGRTDIERQVKKKLDLAKRIAGAGGRPTLRSGVYEKARKAAPGLDVHNAEHEFWAFWEAKGRKPFTKGAEAAFIGFCKQRAKAL